MITLLFLLVWMSFGAWLVYTNRAGHCITGHPPWYIWPVIWTTTLVIVPALYVYVWIIGEDIEP